MKDTRQPSRTTVHSLDEIPAFANEDEEREWWATHELSDELYDQLKPAARDIEELMRLTRKQANRKAAK